MAKAKGAAAAAQGTTNASDTSGALDIEQPTVVDVNADPAPSNPPAEADAEAPPASLRALIESLPEGELKTTLLATHDAETAQAQEAATELINPSAVALQAPENISSFSIEGHEYPVNEHGLIEIALEDAHRVAVALEHGFTRIGAAVRKLL